MASAILLAQEPDLLIFTNGDKLTGHLLRSTGDSVTFHSDMAGDITVSWSKIRELHSQLKFAVVEKGVKLRTNESDAKIPQGRITAANGSIEVIDTSGTPSVTIPLSSTADVIDERTFQRVVLSRPVWYRDWKGTATLGLSIVDATQRGQNYTSAANFVRDIPGEGWMDPESRTILSFISSYGQLKQPNATTLKTSLFHAQAERDRYFGPRFYIFGQGTFDHDYSQGLDLQQTYAAGGGWSIIKTPNRQLDLRAGIAYEDQRFLLERQNQHLVSSIFSETYNRQFPRKIILHQDFTATPSWSNLNALSANADLTLSIPIVKRMSFTIGIANTYLNNPSPGFRKNSFQFTSGITFVQQ